MKKACILFLYLLLFFTNRGFAHEFLPAGSRKSSVGNVTSALPDLWAAQQNPGLLYHIDKFKLGATSEYRFLLSDLNCRAIAIAYPTRSGSFGVSSFHIGNKYFKRSRFKLGFGKKLSNELSAGVSFNCNFISQTDIYGNKGFLTLNLGIYYQVSESFSMGACIINPTNYQLTNYPLEYEPSVFLLGINYTKQDVLVVAEIEKETEHIPNFKTGLEYHWNKQLFIRMGITTNPVTNTFGFGIKLKKVMINFSTTYHQILGVTPHIGLIYEP